MVGYYCCRVLTLVQRVKQLSAKATFSQGILSFYKCVVKVEDKSLNSKSFFSNWFQNLAIDPNLTKPYVLMLSTAYWCRCLCNISITSPQSRRYVIFLLKYITIQSHVIGFYLHAMLLGILRYRCDAQQYPTKSHSLIFVRLAYNARCMKKQWICVKVINLLLIQVSDHFLPAQGWLKTWIADWFNFFVNQKCE